MCEKVYINKYPIITNPGIEPEGVAIHYALISPILEQVGKANYHIHEYANGTNRIDLFLRVKPGVAPSPDWEEVR